MSTILKKIFRKLFFYENYVVGYRLLKSSEAPVGVSNPSYSIISPAGTQWYADPFPFIYQNKHYIFLERYSIWDTKADLAVYCVEEGSEPKCVLSEPFHLSYPNVFEWNNKIYMIPETHNAKQLRLYICVEFPHKWELDTILLDQVDFADTSLMFAGADIWVETMEDQGKCQYTNRLFKLNMANKVISEVQPRIKNWINKRPAGNFFLIGDEWYHALQECAHVYGEYMHISKVSTFNDYTFNETEIRLLKVSDYSINSTLPFIYTHTLNRCRNFEVIDLLYYKFSILKPLVPIWRILKQSFHFMKKNNTK